MSEKEVINSALKYINPEYEPAGDITNFPIEIIDKMLENQVKQGNKLNIKVFEYNKISTKGSGGFDWSSTEEGHSFWDFVVGNKRFDVFFEKYNYIEPIYTPDLLTTNSIKHLRGLWVANKNGSTLTQIISIEITSFRKNLVKFGLLRFYGGQFVIDTISLSELQRNYTTVDGMELNDINILKRFDGIDYNEMQEFYKIENKE